MQDQSFKTLKTVHSARQVCQYLEVRQRKAKTENLKNAYALVILDIANYALETAKGSN